MARRVAVRLGSCRLPQTCGAASLAALAAVLATGRAGDRTAPPRVLATHVVSGIPLNEGVSLGGLSDLFVAPGGEVADGLVAWVITDRGPNGTHGEGKAKRRTLLAPNFAPSIVRLRLPGAGAGDAVVEAVLPLANATGGAVSGRPNGVGRDEPILEADGKGTVAVDPDGVDTEGLVVMPDGSFWATEEYRPSLLRLSATGRVLERHVPEGITLDGAATTVIADIPAVYGGRRDNRGFEGLALSPDSKRLFVLLQSPLEVSDIQADTKAADTKAADNHAGKRTGNVRMLVVDAATGGPLAEHVYRMGDPAAAGWAERGRPPEDGKLCCLTALPDDTLLVLEQDDTGLARVYRADPRTATDTLPRTRAGGGGPLEAIPNLSAAGIEPLAKELVADLAPLVPRFRRDVFGGDGSGGGASLKLEGLAVLDDRHLLVGNDNDFAVPGSSAGGGGDALARSCLWLIGLPTPLSAHDSLTAGR